MSNEPPQGRVSDVSNWAVTVTEGLFSELCTTIAAVRLLTCYVMGTTALTVPHIYCPIIVSTMTVDDYDQVHLHIHRCLLITIANTLTYTN